MIYEKMHSILWGITLFILTILFQVSLTTPILAAFVTGILYHKTYNREVSFSQRMFIIAGCLIPFITMNFILEQAPTETLQGMLTVLLLAFGYALLLNLGFTISHDYLKNKRTDS